MQFPLAIFVLCCILIFEVLKYDTVSYEVRVNERRIKTQRYPLEIPLEETKNCYLCL